MQETYKKIFEMGCREVPHRHFDFVLEEAVMYRGFKISLKEKVYYWEDTRNSNYYDPVDPVITENVLKRGFFIGLTLLMIHTDEEKLHVLGRDIFEMDEQINYWVIKSSENWRNLKSQEKGIKLSPKLDPVQKESRIQLLTKKYHEKKNLYIKKRRVLKEEQEQLEADHAFYSSRIKSYKNQKLWESTVWEPEVQTKHFSTYSKGN